MGTVARLAGGVGNGAHRGTKTQAMSALRWASIRLITCLFSSKQIASTLAMSAARSVNRDTLSSH